MASIENCQYVLTNFYASGQCCTSVFQMAAESILRDFFSVPIHAATGIIIGCGFAEAYANKLVSTFLSLDVNLNIWSLINIGFDDQSPINCCGCILYLPVLLHGSYDGLLLWSGFEISQTQNLWFGLADLGAFGIVITAWVIALYKVPY